MRERGASLIRMDRGRRGFVVGLGAFGACAPALGCGRAKAPAVTEAPSAAAGPGDDPFAELAGFCDGVEPIAASEYERRIERVRAKLAEAGQGALILEAGVDMRYFGGPRWGQSERPLMLVIPRDGEPLLVGPAFERGTLEARRGPLAFAVRTWEEHESPYALVFASLSDARIKAEAIIATGPATRSFVIDGLRDAAPSRSFGPGQAAIEACRRVKSPAELALLRRANEATKRAIESAAAHVRAGMHEHEFADHVRAAQLAAGLDNVWVLALFGPNAAYPHGTPEGRELAPGDLILVDTGGFLHGYASDITRTWAFPEPSAIDADRQRAWEVVRAAQTAALDTIRPGVRCAEVDAAARAVIAAAGFDPDYGHFSHRLGHGIGMEVHEAPYLVRDAEHRLEVGNTMSDEPGLYLAGRYGIRLEDIVAVTAEGAEVFGPRADSLAAPFGG
ncbi:proline dipeptidase [Enhygromyxa salina]|uniref:Proline dipeptidase n=1 Tax=Enhygromyxa salina TaxID=215803 RepID=A0A0C2D3V2_9BACT|nr:Xaa-Pro peptidase family protein [Enhygromyxa salina]KIG16405.1 proline dipeptidase [Enhygromyxa salina]